MKRPVPTRCGVDDSGEDRGLLMHKSIGLQFTIHSLAPRIRDGRDLTLTILG